MQPLTQPSMLPPPPPPLLLLQGIKSRTMDLVLFVRHGSFYNLFDVDADVGLRVGLNLSGPPAANFWKVGCFKDQFAVWAAKVGTVVTAEPLLARDSEAHASTISDKHPTKGLFCHVSRCMRSSECAALHAS